MLSIAAATIPSIKEKPCSLPYREKEYLRIVPVIDDVMGKGFRLYSETSSLCLRQLS